jgi:hypothetical protein
VKNIGLDTTTLLLRRELQTLSAEGEERCSATGLVDLNGLARAPLLGIAQAPSTVRLRRTSRAIVKG